MTLVDRNGNVVQTNNNWKDSQQAAAIQATGQAPPNDLEAAILATVRPETTALFFRATVVGRG